MGAQCDERGIRVSARTDGEDIAQLVAMYVSKREFGESLSQPQATRIFAPRRRRNGRHLQLQIFQMSSVRAKPCEGLMHPAKLGNPCHLLLRRSRALRFTGRTWLSGRGAHWRTWAHEDVPW